jgi:hypothetical protein
MNEQPNRERAGLAYLVGIIGAFLIIGALVWVMIHYTEPAPLGKKRAEERAAALAEMRGEDIQSNTVAWLNQSNGLIRLRIEDAMRLVEREWRNPAAAAAARSNLIARVEKATAAPPKPPEKPSPFE